MQISSEQYERLMRFMDANMSVGEMQAFAIELDADPALRQQLEFEQTMRDNIVSYAAETKVVSIADASPNKSKYFAFGWAVAAAIAVGVFATILFTVNTNKPPKVIAHNVIDTGQNKKTPTINNDTLVTKNDDKVFIAKKLFNSFFEADAVPESYPMYLAAAFEDYQQGDYTTFQQLDLNELPQTRGTNDVEEKQHILLLGHYYKALSLLKLGKTKLAITELDWVTKHSPNVVFKQKAYWYTALANLQLGNQQQAIDLLGKLKDNKEYATKAANLLKQLRK